MSLNQLSTISRLSRASRGAVVVVALVCGAIAPALAADNYVIDVGHSNVGFSVRHFFSKVPGQFTKYEGSIVLDAQDMTKSSVNVSIDTASITTNIADRDKHLKSADFFDAEKFPKITFASTKVTAVSATKLTVEGTLTMKGVSKPVTLDVDILGSGPDAWGGYRGGFEAKTKVNRQDYGVAWNKVMEGGGTMLGDEVEVTLNVEAIRQAPKPAEAAPKKSS